MATVRVGWLAGIIGITSVLFTATGHAQEQPAGTAPPAAENEDEEGPDLGLRRPPAPDLRTLHVLVTARGGLSGPVGDNAVGVPASDAIAVGPSFGAALGLGMGRNTVLELTGTYGSYSAAEGCAGCSAKSVSLGLGLVYHVTQGMAVDPWVGYGLGYRSSSFAIPPALERGTGGPRSGLYQGLDFARLGLGANFYPTPWLGFGPYFEAGMGTYLARPAALEPGPALYGFLEFGLAITLDPRQFGAAPTARTVARLR